jgi:translation initiation factor 2B subunit (eIF-2B alpha/beta/delta family)
MRIEDDTISGAAVLTEQVLHRIQELIEGPYPSREAFLAALQAECSLLSESQKSMVSIHTALSRVYSDAKGGKTLPQVKELAKNSTVIQLKHLHDAESAVITLGSSLIKDGFEVLTHSRSSTIEKILVHAYREISFHTVVTESRPQNEGRILAESLAERGMPVTYIVDAAAGAFEPDLVVVGADAVTPHYVVNKIGTSLLAARFPVYVACTTHKFTCREVDIEEQNPGEILLDPHPGITIKNYYFDRTPLDMITGFVTERGILTPEEVRSLF